IGNPSLNHRYRKGFYSLFKTLQQNQLYNVIKILDSIFGKDKFVCSFVWRRRNHSELNEENISVEHEYILCYSKSPKYNVNYKFSTWIDTISTNSEREDEFYELESMYQNEARKYINDLFNKEVVTNYPKPVTLLEEVFSIFLRDGDKILDIFGGSGTTGEACMKLNAAKNIKVDFVIVQISKPKPEKTIYNISNLIVKRNQKALEAIQVLYGKSNMGFGVFKDSFYTDEILFKEID
ncbi:DNA methyltransferase, partial [Enterococcus gallinarum]